MNNHSPITVNAVLNTLAMMSNPASLTVIGEWLSRQMPQDISAINLIVQNLIEHKMVENVSTPEDRPKKFQLTEAGHNYFLQVFRDPEHFVIAHYYGVKPPVPGAELQSDGSYSITIEDLFEFTNTYGPIQLKPPTLERPFWFIWVTDQTGKFTQK
jgi:hypothetical protein